MNTKDGLIIGVGILGTILIATNTFGGSTNSATQAPVAPPPTSSVPLWPLRRGSRGQQVRTLQNALLARGGEVAKIIQSTGGADGIFGSGTEKALTTAGFPATVSQVTYNILMTGTGATGNPAPPASTAAPTGTHLFADSWSGTSVYVGPGNRGKNISIKSDTYLGKLTGRTEGSFMEFETGISFEGGENMGRYKAWASKLQTKSVDSAQLTQYMATEGQQKSPAVLAWFLQNASKA